MYRPDLNFFHEPLARSEYRPLAAVLAEQAVKVTIQIDHHQFPKVLPAARGFARAFLFMTGQPQNRPNIATFSPASITLVSGFNQDHVTLQLANLTTIQVGALKAQPNTSSFGVVHQQAQFFQLLTLVTQKQTYYFVTETFAGLEPLLHYFQQLGKKVEDPLGLAALVAQVQPGGMVAALEQTYQQRILNTGYPANTITSLTE